VAAWHLRKWQQQHNCRGFKQLQTVSGGLADAANETGWGSCKTQVCVCTSVLHTRVCCR
jgi:hypothetical protein